MDNHKSYLKTLESNAIKSLETLQTLEEIENWRIEYLGRKGKLSQFFQSFKDIKIENKNELGTIANDLKISLEQYYKKKINSINPNVKINIYKKKITNLNINKIIPEYDIVVDGSDNFETKYLINDACIKNKKILISASLNGFEAQIITFKPWIKSTNNPCYRCLFPENYKNTNTYNCREGGIIGGLAGTIGSLQSVEVIKEILNIGESLNGKLLIIDLLNGNLKKLKVKRNKKCLNYCKFLIKD